MKAHISHEWWCYFILKCHHIWNFFLCAVVRLYTFQVFLFFLMIWCDGKHFRKTRTLRTQNKWYLGEKLHYFPYASFHALQPRNRNWCIFHGIYFGLVSKLLSKHYNVSVWYSRSIYVCEILISAIQDRSMVSLFSNWNRKENEKLIWMSYVSSQFQGILKVSH